MNELYGDVIQIKREWLCLTMDQISAEFIIGLFKKSKTYEDIRFPGSKGFSIASIEPFCKKNCLSPRVSKEYLGEIVSKAVDEVRLFFFYLCLVHVFICNYK